MESLHSWFESPVGVFSAFVSAFLQLNNGTHVLFRSVELSIYASSPPSYLAASVHSLLLSTLLQPSAVFLAIWYMVRLPVYFSATRLGTEYVKEARFRHALLGDSRSLIERESMEAGAPFRLIVLGCMLANKWLDDHTFSNKTWYVVLLNLIHIQSNIFPPLGITFQTYLSMY